MEWQPIETAPKDGTPILLYLQAGDGTDTERTIDIGVWAEWRGWPKKCWCMNMGDGWPGATHWMPLPEPPQ